MSAAPPVSSQRLSQRLTHLEPSATVALTGRVKQMQAQGIPVISFGQGEPGFPTPVPIKLAAFEAIERNYTGYTPAGGIPPLRRAIAERVSSDTGITYTPAQITVTNGVKEALFLLFLAYCDPGDEVIVPAPYWVSYVEQVRLSGAMPVVAMAAESNGFKLTPEELAAQLSPRTRSVILSSPNNPTGTVYSADELAALAEVLRKHNQTLSEPMLIITDEIYDRICYVEYARWLQVAPDFAPHTLVLNGLSKTYSMTGWRLGYAAGPEPLIAAIRSLQTHSTTHPASITQYAALAAYTPSAELDEAVNQMTSAFTARRDVMLQALQQVSSVTCVVPDGAFYVFPNVQKLLNRPLRGGITCTNTLDLANYLLDEAHIGVVPGEAFGAPGYLRIAYTQNEPTINEGMRRFAESVI